MLPSHREGDKVSERDNQKPDQLEFDFGRSEGTPSVAQPIQSAALFSFVSAKRAALRRQAEERVRRAGIFADLSNKELLEG